MANAHLSCDAKCVWAYFERRGSQAGRPKARDLLQGVGGAEHQFAFRLDRKRTCNLMDPAMHPEFMPLRCDPALLIRIQRGGDARHEESRTNVVSMQKIEDAREPDQAPILAPAQAADRLAAITQFVGLMVTVKRQRDGAACAVFPGWRMQPTTGAHAIN